MSKKIKIGLYIVFAILTVWTGLGFLKKLKENSTAPVEPKAATNEVVQAASTNTPAVTETNVTTAPATNAAVTNETVAATNAAVTAVDTNTATNVVVTTTNESAAAPPASSLADEESIAKKKSVTSAASLISAIVKFAACLICLGGLIAYDVSQYLGNRSLDFIFNDDLKGMKDPEYEQAEQAWANGKPLEAIQMMREYLRKHPREQYVSLRIAEIYEKDLNNQLAAALEYEQVLQHNLPRERWGWAAIHLCNLYSKLGRASQATDLLRRIAEEYSETAAAKKARKRLAMFESVGDATTLGTDVPEDPNAPEIPPPAPKGPIRVELKKKEEPEEPPSNLPPGFRPKK